MKVLIAPDKFKGSLSAVGAAEAITRGFRSVLTDSEFDVIPIADGGEGFADALAVALHGTWSEVNAHDALGRPIKARYLWVPDRKLAVIEMSEASGLWRIKAEERAPLRATSFGTGELIRHAAVRGAETMIVGLGGSATTDAGLGMAAALGYKFLSHNRQSPAVLPENFLSFEQIDASEALRVPDLVAACDVQNPLLGPRGTAHVFAPQKGADAKSVAFLERALEHIAELVQTELGSDFREMPGAGAAGGLGYGLLTFCNARILSGFDVVADAVRLEERVAACDLVVTGEGSLDAQTLEGKGPAGVAALARKHGKPVLAFAGLIRDHEKVDALFAATVGIVDEAVTLPEAMERAGEFLERAAGRVGRLLQLGMDL